MRARLHVDCLDHARACVRAALDGWDATDLTQVDSCRVLLEQSVSDLQELEANLQTYPAGMPQDSIADIDALKQDIAMMVRLVDAGSAFYRGVALRLGDAGPAYDQSGMAPAEAAAPALRGMQI